MEKKKKINGIRNKISTENFSMYILRNFKIAIYLEWNFKKKGNEFTFRVKTHCKKNVKLLSAPVRNIRVYSLEFVFSST